MKTLLSPSLVTITLLLSASLPSLAQTPAPPPPPSPSPVPTRPHRNDPFTPPVAATSGMLSANYQITLSASFEGKALGELSVVSCNPEVSVNGPLNSDAGSTILHFTGLLAEENGILVLNYGIGFSVPVSTSDFKPNPPHTSRPQHQQLLGEGSLLMKAGTPCEVLKVGGVTYTITLTQAPSQ